MKRKALVMSSLLAFSIGANAEGGYIGLSVGQTDVDISGFDDGTSIALVGGYRVNSNFAIEASYIDLGESEDDIAPVWTLEADGFNFSAVGIIPVNEQVEIFGKIGMFMWDVTLDEAGTGEIASDDGTDISFGVGGSVKLAEQFSLVLEFQRFDIDGDDVDNISLGGRINF